MAGVSPAIDVCGAAGNRHDGAAGAALHSERQLGLLDAYRGFAAKACRYESARCRLCRHGNESADYAAKLIRAPACPGHCAAGWQSPQLRRACDIGRSQRPPICAIGHSVCRHHRPRRLFLAERGPTTAAVFLRPGQYNTRLVYRRHQGRQGVRLVGLCLSLTGHAPRHRNHRPGLGRWTLRTKWQEGWHSHRRLRLDRYAAPLF